MNEDDDDDDDDQNLDDDDLSDDADLESFYAKNGLKRKAPTLTSSSQFTATTLKRPVSTFEETKTTPLKSATEQLITL